MTTHDPFDGIDDVQAALIDQRIGQAFAFVHDVIAAPGILEEIPDGSELVFRDVAFRGVSLRLTAHLSGLRPHHWTARVTGPAPVATESQRWTPRTDVGAKGGKWSTPATYPEQAATPQAALDALEAKLRDADFPRDLSGPAMRW
jgi:hypothetical protein